MKQKHTKASTEAANITNKAIIFARVSTTEQEQGHSLEAQIAKLQDYAKKNNLNVIETFDVTESSTRGDRPKFHEMIAFVNAQKGQIALICDKVDRLQRGFSELPILDKLRKENKLVLHFLDIGKLDSEANSQQISFYQMSVVMANAYTNAISDNVKRSVKFKLSNGECIQRAPVGYTNIRTENDKSDVIVDELRAPFVVQMFEMYSLGSTSLGDLEKFAIKHNITNNTKKSVNPLSKNVISDMIKNSFYYGEIYVAKYGIFPHKYPTLISKSLFDECQKVTQARSKQNNRIQAVQTSKEGKDFIFKGPVTCAVTERTVTCDDKKDDRGYINVYLITRDPENPDKKVYVREKDVLAEIEKVFKSLVCSEPLLTQIIDHLKSSHDDEQVHHERKLADIEKKIKKCEADSNALLRAYIDKANGISQDMFIKMKEEIEEQISKLESSKEMYKGADKNFKQAVVTAFHIASEAYEIFTVSKNDEKHDLIEFVFSKLTLRGKKLEYTLRCPFDLMVNLSDYTDWLPGRDSNPRPID
jgi:site-specific DNA recombinase